MVIHEAYEHKILPLIKKTALEEGVQFSSCLDVGSGLRHHNSWFNKFELTKTPRRYIAADTDADIIRELHKQGVEAVNPLLKKEDIKRDLVLALEVIEHLKESDIDDFFSFLKSNTGKMLAITTPNFEYWQDLKPKKQFEALRWVPDHFKDWKPISNNPHAHKTSFTPTRLYSTVINYFSLLDWNIYVFRAWPWKMHDLACNKEFVLFFKVFAIVSRK